MKKILLSIFINCLAIVCYAQEKESTTIIVLPKIAKNIFYGELGGRGLAFSFNYERMLYYKPAFQLTARVGMGGAGTVSLKRSNGGGGGMFTMPLNINLLFGKDKNHFEIGGGFTYYSGDYEEFRPMLGFGYRLQKPEGGFFLNTNLNFMIYDNSTKLVFPIPSFAIGYAF